MVNIVEGNLLEAKEDIISYQVNCQGCSDSSLGLAIRRKYYKCYKDYYEITSTTREKSKLLGKCLVVNCGDKIIANLFGIVNILDINSQINCIALEKSLRELKKYARENRLSVALPFKDSFVKNFDNWNKIYNIITEVFVDYDVTLYKYNKGGL